MSQEEVTLGEFLQSQLISMILQPASFGIKSHNFICIMASLNSQQALLLTCSLKLLICYRIPRERVEKAEIDLKLPTEKAEIDWELKATPTTGAK